MPPAKPDVRRLAKPDVRRSAERFTTRTERLTSRHSFSFGSNYDPDNTEHGLLVAHNDILVAPGGGFEAHRHQDMEIVTWVLHGSLVHQDSTGRGGELHPGTVQRMSAGAGVVHSERNGAGSSVEQDAPSEPVRFLQMWVPPDEPGGPPHYEQRDVSAALNDGLVPVVSGLPRHAASAAVHLANSRSALHVGRLRSPESVALPDAPYLHLFVATGSSDLEGVGVLAEGDAVRLTDARPRRVHACEGTSEILVWEMHAGLRSR